MSNQLSFMNAMKEHDLTCPKCKNTMNGQPSALMIIGKQEKAKASCAYCGHVFQTIYKNGILSAIDPSKPEIAAFPDFDDISYVEPERLSEIIKTCEKKSSHGKYYSYDYQDKTFTAVDNSTGDAWTEEFTDIEIMRKWLSGEIEIAEVHHEE